MSQGTSWSVGEGGYIFGVAWSQEASLAVGGLHMEVESCDTVAAEDAVEAACDLASIALLIHFIKM